RVDRAGDIAVLVGLMVHLLELGPPGEPVPGKVQLRMQSHARHGELARGVLAEDSNCLVDVAIDAEAAFRRHVQEGEHVAARESGYERLLGIHCRLDRERQPHRERRGGCRYLDSAVETPHVRTAVTVVGEGRITSFPADGGGIAMLGHGGASLYRR